MTKQQEIQELKAALRLATLRAKNLNFTYDLPDWVFRNRTGSAYHSGYEAGWRGWQMGADGYTREHFQDSYRLGWFDANRALHTEARAAK